MSRLSLVADIGGTNTRVALADGINVRHDSVRRFINAQHAGIAPLIAQYISECGARVDGACVAVAGPVANGVGRLTNLDWGIDKAELAAVSGASVAAVINDLQAQGFALGHIPLRQILAGRPVVDMSSQLVVGVGTGFNSSPVNRTEHGVNVLPSETGHVTLPVRTEDQARVARYIEGIHGIATVEEALSGRGMTAIHACLTGQTCSTNELIPLIGKDEAVTATARVFVGFLGSVVGNLALTHLPFGGIALCGGMSRALAPHLETLGFAQAMHDKGRFSAFVEAFPVSVVEDDYAALTGCAASLR